VTSSHNLKRLSVSFDAPSAVAHAGLLLPATLGERLGLRQLIDQHVQLGAAAGAPNPGRKALTVVASLLAGGDCIDDADVLRKANAAAVLGHQVAAPSTLGTFLRSFSAGHARQLDAVMEDLLQRAWDAGAGPERKQITVDLDSSLLETYGLQKQGASGFTYTHVRGYHPLFAILSEGGEVLHSRLREGRANAGRGAGSFVRQALSRLRRAGAVEEVVVRADSGFYAQRVVQACRHHDARFSISVRLQRSHHDLIASIPEQQWQPIPYWLEGAADVAEIAYQPFGQKRAYRLIVRRVAPTPGSQLWLQGLAYSHHAFLTDRQGELLEVEADHRRHAQIENVIKELKYGFGLNHMPSGRFGANAAWLALNAIAYNLSRWLARLGEQTHSQVKALRHRFFALPGRLVCSSRRQRLRLPRDWPWQVQFLELLARLRALAPQTG